MFFSKRNNYISIPVIILSTLSGTASVGSSSLFEGETKLSSIVIGLVAIGVGILNTIQNYFGFARKAESHRIAYLHYSKLFSNIRVELSLPRDERMNPQDILKVLRESMERLAETTPTPPQHVLDMFNRHFKDEDKSISRPVEVNGLQKIFIHAGEQLRKSGTFEQSNPLHTASPKSIGLSLENVAHPVNEGTTGLASSHPT